MPVKEAQPNLLEAYYKWASRWLYSTNHKDIGTLYLIFGFIAEVIGTTMSIMICLEFANPGNQIFNDNHQLYYAVMQLFLHTFFL